MDFIDATTGRKHQMAESPHTRTHMYTWETGSETSQMDGTTICGQARDVLPHSHILLLAPCQQLPLQEPG